MLRYIHIAKGIGILLVILFHFGPSTWWTPTYDLIGQIVYKHHMPLFMVLSGFLFTFKQASGISFQDNYIAHLQKKSLRLLLPYLSVSLLYAGMKFTGQHFFTHRALDWQSLANTFTNPGAGLASLLWFLYVLFVFVSVMPIALRYLDELQWLGIGLALSLIPVEHDLLLRLCRFFPMFMTGMVLRKYALLDQLNVAWCGTISACLFGMICLVDQSPFLVSPPAIALAGGLSGTLFWVSIAKWLDRQHNNPLTSLFDALGQRSAAIYLMHQPFVWLPPVLLHSVFGWSSAATLWALPVSVTLGLTVPLILEQQILNRSKWLSLLILGATPPAMTPQFKPIKISTQEATPTLRQAS